MNLHKLLLAGVLLSLGGPAAADCTIAGSVRQCIDTVEELHVDSPGNVYVWFDADDEADLACLTLDPGADATQNGIILRTTHANFDNAFQTLLLAYSRRLRVDVNVGITGGLGFEFCNIIDVSIRP